MTNVKDILIYILSKKPFTSYNMVYNLNKHLYFIDHGQLKFIRCLNFLVKLLKKLFHLKLINFRIEIADVLAIITWTVSTPRS